jgi:SAM-dependent methyltransferase
MTIVYLIGAVMLVCFSGVLLFGAPYLPTLKPQVETALKISQLKRGQTMLELGCGDGKVLLAAARQGIQVVGYELNPLLYLLCRIRTWRYRKYVRVIWGSFWQQPWPAADVIFVFLLPKYMNKLDKKIMQYKHKPVKLVSFAFVVKDREPTKQQDGLFLYDYN